MVTILTSCLDIKITQLFIYTVHLCVSVTILTVSQCQRLHGAPLFGGSRVEVGALYNIFCQTHLYFLILFSCVHCQVRIMGPQSVLHWARKCKPFLCVSSEFRNIQEIPSNGWWCVVCKVRIEIL